MSKAGAEDKTISVNRKARHDYEVLDSLEAGLVLTGTEIKSIRDGKVNIREAFAKPQGRELWLVNAHISPYHAGNINNHDPYRPRKLLLHKDQATYLVSNVAQKGLSVVPLRLYIKNHVAKVELGLVRGKKQYDKRRTIMERDQDREAQRALRRVV